jgi:hypothetical protein
VWTENSQKCWRFSSSAKCSSKRIILCILIHFWGKNSKLPNWGWMS